MSWWFYPTGFAAAGLALSLRFTFWRRDIPGVPVLMYHYLTDDLSGTGLRQLRVSPEAFARQMAYLRKSGYRTIAPWALWKHFTEGLRLPERPLIVTFDDAARESLMIARDVMSRFGFSATVFVPAGRVGGTNDWDRGKGEPEVALADWEDLRGLALSGWEIGSHSLSHADLTSLGDRELAGELAESKRLIESELGRPVVAVAYPYGAVDGRVRQAAREAGYQLGFGTRHGKNTREDDLHGLKRIIVKRRDTLLDLGLKLKKGRSTV